MSRLDDPHELVDVELASDAPASAPVNGHADPGSALDRLRRQADSPPEHDPIDLVVPGWKDGVQIIARYGAPERWSDLRALLVRGKIGETPFMPLTPACDVLLLCLRNLFLRDTFRDTPREPLDPSGGELRVGPRLMEILQLPVGDDDRQRLRALYRREDAAISAHASFVVGQLSGLGLEEVSEDSLGEA
jgi:hypothetical protein